MEPVTVEGILISVGGDFRLCGYCPHPSNLSPLVQHSIHNSHFVNARKLASEEAEKRMATHTRLRVDREKFQGQIASSIERSSQTSVPSRLNVQLVRLSV